MRTRIDPEKLKHTDFFRWDFYSNILQEINTSPIVEAFHQWKTENKYAWKMLTKYAEECVRIFSKNIIADAVQCVLLHVSQLPFAYTLALRYDRSAFRASQEYFLTNTWPARYIHWLFSRLFPHADSSYTEERIPRSLHHPSLIERHLISGISDFLSGEFVLPVLGKWISLFHLSSPFPSKSIAAVYSVLSLTARGIGQLPGIFLNHHGLAHWGNLVGFTALNVIYIMRFVYPSLGEDDSTNIADRCFKDTDLYKALNVTPSAHTDDILKAYKRKSLELHPDRNVHCSEAERAYVQEQFKVVNEAKRILTDTRSRFIYDQGLSAEHFPRGTSGETFDGEGESIESIFRRLFLLETWGLHFHIQKSDSITQLLHVLPPVFALSSSVLIFLPMLLQLNIAHWQHLSSESGTHMLRMMQSLLAFVLL